MDTTTVVALASLGVAACAVGLSLWTLSRSRDRIRSLDAELERTGAQFAALVAEGAKTQADRLAETLALARAESLSLLAAEERRIAEERRREVALFEHEAGAKLSAALGEAQRKVEQRLADWGTHLDGLQQSLAANLERTGQRQQQLAAEVETRILEESSRFQTVLDDHRNRLAKLRDDLQRSIEETARAASSELDAHAAERRRALQQVAERLHTREEEIRKQLERDQAETTQQLAAHVQEVEHRQIEQLRRVVARESQDLSARAARDFETAIRGAREEAARRLTRQLDIAVERFVRNAETVLSERVDTELRNVEARLATIGERLDALSRSG